MAVVRHGGKVCLDCAMGNLLIELGNKRLREEGVSEEEIAVLSVMTRDEWDVELGDC